MEYFYLKIGNYSWWGAMFRREGRTVDFFSYNFKDFYRGDNAAGACDVSLKPRKLKHFN